MVPDPDLPLKASSRARLTRQTVAAFPGRGLRDRLGRVVSAAECLPRKEFFEAWAVAKRVRRRLRGGRVVELAAGHGLLSAILLLLDPRSPAAVLVDKRRPESFGRLQAALVEAWPSLAGRLTFVEGRLEEQPIAPDDVVVSVHACGRLTDRVLAAATAARARVAVLPCCQRVRASETHGLEGWLEGRLAVDVARAERLRGAGYRVSCQTIPAEITPQNRLLIGEPG